MNKEQLKTLLEDRFPGCSVTFDEPLSIVIRPRDGMYETTEFTFDDLDWVATTLKTRSINLRYESGWCGTAVTPGDPAEMCLRISKIGSEA